MISDLKEAVSGPGSLPEDIYSYDGPRLAKVLIDLQGQRVKLNEGVNDARRWRDEAMDRIAAAVSLAEGEAHQRLPPGRGGKLSAASVKAYVDSHPSVISAKTERQACSREVARLDDQLGAVRSGLRVVGQLLELELAKTRPATPEEW